MVQKNNFLIESTCIQKYACEVLDKNSKNWRSYEFFCGTWLARREGRTWRAYVTGSARMEMNETKEARIVARMKRMEESNSYEESEGLMYGAVIAEWCSMRRKFKKI